MMSDMDEQGVPLGLSFLYGEINGRLKESVESYRSRAVETSYFGDDRVAEVSAGMVQGLRFAMNIVFREFSKKSGEGLPAFTVVESVEECLLRHKEEFRERCIAWLLTTENPNKNLEARILGAKAAAMERALSVVKGAYENAMREVDEIEETMSDE